MTWVFRELSESLLPSPIGWSLNVCPHLRRVSEDFLQSLLKSINIVVDEVLPVNLTLVDQTDEREALVDLS